ncbi:signal-induced proliferation-associated 1-like protein 1 [Pollicipes pollicipes]|uniref:signal-induced proliferation-associated 1-like protein 1 n=1 Tax=Pollicipes pollicipes TaxID=41117 RepID=UPI0018854D01|nr:signal-induced proliferation-associated 1-like protein 1 [Pollicipes pollicipes]
MLVSLAAAARRHSQLACRKNTATGASAASMPASTRGERRRPDEPADAAEPPPDEDEDRGDDRSNDLVCSCPFFRNELGGERDRALQVTPGSGRRRRAARPDTLLHRPPASCGLSVLEQPVGMTHWPAHRCPFSRPGTAIEHSNVGSFYYKDFFHGREHENWVGTDESLGPVAVSVRRDRLEAGPGGDGPDRQQSAHPCYRIIIRSSELPTVRGLILEESLCHLVKPAEKTKRLPVREILDHVAPELQPACLRLAVAEPRTEDYLMKLDQQYVFTRYKVGVMYCRAGQSTEEEMYNNEESGPAFEEFLEMLGQRVRLKGFDKYKAGLDNKTDSTGQYSVYVKHQENEIMFHVSTLLQFSPNNRQQLLRKRYIGNDIVTIVFQEPGALPFTPKHIRSQFQHVFIVVQAVNPCSGNTQYRVAVNRFRDVPPFGPPIPESATFTKSQAFAEFLYAKVINAENAAYQSDKFMTMAKRTRHEYLKDLATNYLTENTLDAPQKFSIMSFSSRRKERLRPRFVPDAVQRGAVCWPVTADDQSLHAQVECLLGVSADSLVLLEQATGGLVFAAPTASVLGWTLQGTSLRVYYHTGECVALHPHTALDTEELAEIAARLAAVTTGTDTREMLLRRNQLGQLGFHVQSDGLVTEVESYGPAWQAGLRQGARLVEICKIAVCSMSHDQMVDLLKTSVAVSLAVLPPAADGAARRSQSPDGVGRTGGEYAAPAAFQPRPPGAPQGHRKEAFAYIELASMNCGILMEAKNDNSKSTYLTDSDVEVYIPATESGVRGRGIANSRSSGDLSVCSPLARVSHGGSDQYLSSNGTPLRGAGAGRSAGSLTGSQQSIGGRSSRGSAELGVRSEDELSAHSCSPTLRRRARADASTPSSGGSGAASPHARAAAARGPAGGGEATPACPLAAEEPGGVLTTARPTQVAPPPVPLPAAQVDWQALVDTAARAVRVNPPLYRSPPGDAAAPAAAEPPPPDQLQTRLSSLEHQLLSEQSKRERLETQVQQLSSDNQRLQQESRLAAQQLRNFTQWFFSHVEKP